VAAVLHDVARGVALAEPRRQERPPQERHPDLAAVEVARHRQGDVRGHAREEVRVVGEEDHGRSGGHVAQRAADVRPAVAEVLDAGDPQPARVGRLVLEHRDPRVLQRGAHPGAVVVPVVVAEHGDDATRRAQGAEAGGDRPRRDRAAERDLGVDVVAEQEDEVRAACVDRRDEALDPLLANVRRAGVQVGEQRDPEPGEVVRPAGEGEVALPDPVAARLLPERAPRDRGGGGAGGRRARGGGSARTRHRRQANGRHGRRRLASGGA